MNRVLRALGLAWLCCAADLVAAEWQEWQTINIMGIFSFAAPRDLKSQKVQGIDSLVGSYRSASMTLGFDHGWYSDALSDAYPNAQDVVRKTVTINGRPAKLLQMRQKDQHYPYVVAVHFPDLDRVKASAAEGSTAGGLREQEVSLTVWIQCKTERDAEYAKLIVRSVNVAGP